MNLYWSIWGTIVFGLYIVACLSGLFGKNAEKWRSDIAPHIFMITTYLCGVFIWYIWYLYAGGTA